MVRLQVNKLESMNKPKTADLGEESHDSIRTILDKAILVESSAGVIAEDLGKMVEGTRYSIAFAKPYMDNRRYAKFDLTQFSSMPPVNDALILFNFVFSQYCAARAKFSDLAKTCSSKVRALVPRQKVIDELQQKPLVRYMDFIVGDCDPKAEGSRGVSLPIGAIGVIVYQFPDDLRRSLWKDGQVDCTKIRVPEEPTEMERRRYREQLKKRGESEGLEDPDEVYQNKIVAALLLIMSLRPRDMLTFLVQGGGAARMRCNSSIGLERNTRQLLADRGRMEAAIITYADIASERDCDILDHAAYFSVVSASRIFYRCMEHNCAIFDLRTNKRFRSIEEFLAAVFLEDTDAPRSDSLREQHDRWAIIAEELETRMDLIHKLKQKIADKERTRLEATLGFRIGLGSTTRLLLNAAQCASIIRAEMTGSYSTAEDVDPELRANCMRSRWEKFRDYVDERTKMANDDTFPFMWRISKWFLRWQDHNIATPTNMAAFKHDPFEGKHYWDAATQLRERSQCDKAASFMRESGLFRSHLDEMYKNCHNALNLLAWPFSPTMDDTVQVREMLHRVIFPSDGFHVFDARCETRMLRSSDDFLLILIDIAKRSGAQCNAVEAARFILYTLESNGVDKERRHILLVGSGAAGKSTLLNFCSKVVNGRGVSQSETKSAIVYETSGYLPPFKDEDSGFKENIDFDIQAGIYTLFATQPHEQHDSEGGKEFKTTTAIVNTREIVTPMMSQNRTRSGGVVSVQEYKKRFQQAVCPTDLLKVTNLCPIRSPLAVLSRLRWFVFPDGIGSRYEGASRALFGLSENPVDMNYLRDLYALIFLAFHWRNCGGLYQKLFSAGAIESAFYGNVNSPAMDTDSPGTDVAAARRNRRLLAVPGNTSPCTNMNTSIYTRFNLQLDAEKISARAAYSRRSGSEANNDFHVRFKQSDVDHAIQRFGVYLAGVKSATNSQAVGSGRTDGEMSREIRARNTTGFVRSAIEHNFCGNSFDHYDVLAAYPWISVPRDPDSALDVIKGIQTSDFFQPGMLQAARSVIALVLFACTKWPENVKFNEKTGYITLDRFFDPGTSTDNQPVEGEEEGGEPRGRLIPGPDPSNPAGTRFIMEQTANPRRLRRSASSSTDDGMDSSAMLKALNEKNPTQMSHIKSFNKFCSQRYESPEIPESFMMTFRLMLMRAKSSSVLEDAPFIRSVGMDARAENKLEIHCMLFGLPLMLEHAINLLVHELRVPKVVLTYDVQASKSGPMYDRSPSALVLFPRACDKKGFAAGSSYRSEDDLPVFPGLSEDSDQAKVRKALGIAEEKDPCEFGSIEELGVFLEFPQFSDLFDFEQKLATSRCPDADRRYDDGVDEDVLAVIAVDPQHKPVPDKTLDQSVAADASRADEFQRELNLGSSDDGVAIGALSQIQALIGECDLQSLQFAEKYITKPDVKVALRELEKSGSIDYQQTLGYRIATLAETAFGNPGADPRSILDQIRTRMNQLIITNNGDSRVLGNYLRETGKYVTQVNARDLKDLRVVHGNLQCLDVIGELGKKWKSSVTEPVLFEPTVHDDDVIESAHNNRLEDVNSSVYSCTGAWIRDKIPMSFSLVEQETTAVASQMLGYEYQPSHFTNDKKMADKTDKIARIKYAVKVLRPLFACSTTLMKVEKGELCYSNRNSDGSGRSITTASEYRKVMRGMLMDFLDLMILFTRTTGLQSPYVDPSLCVFQSMQLGISWTHSQIMAAAMLMYSSINPEDIRAAYGLQLDQWLEDVIAITPGRRQTILENRHRQFGSADYLIKSKSGEVDFSKNVERLMFYPTPSDRTPDTDAIKKHFVLSRRETKPDVYRVDESKQQMYRLDRPEAKKRSNETEESFVLTPKRSGERKTPRRSEQPNGVHVEDLTSDTDERKSNKPTATERWMKRGSKRKATEPDKATNGHHCPGGDSLLNGDSLLDEDSLLNGDPVKKTNHASLLSESDVLDLFN